MTDAHNTVPSKLPYKTIVLSIVLSVIAYFVFIVISGWEKVVIAFSDVGFYGLVIALGLTLANIAFRFLRWHYYLQKLDKFVPFHSSLRIYLAGFALTTTPGKAGEIIRSVFLKRYKITYSESVAAFFSERLSDLIAVLILCGLGAWRHQSAQPFLILLSVLVVSGLFILQYRQLLNWIFLTLQRVLKGKARSFSTSIADMLIHFRTFFTLSTMIYGIVLGVVAWGAQALMFFYVANAMGGAIDISEAVFIYAFSLLVGVVSMLPGGLVGFELTMIGLLIVNGMDEPQAAACTVFTRLVALWFTVIIGLLSIPPNKTNQQC